MAEVLGTTEGTTLLAEISGASGIAWMLVGTVLPVLLLAGAVKCFLILRRPSTSSPCVWSLATLLGGGAFAAVLNYAGAWVESPVLGEVFYWGSRTVFAAVLLATVILALLGLALYADHTQGRKQAIAALALTGVFGCLLIGNVVVRFLEMVEPEPSPVRTYAHHSAADESPARDARPAANKPTAKPRPPARARPPAKATPVPVIEPPATAPLRVEAPPPDRTAALSLSPEPVTPATGQVLRFDDANFTCRLPSYRWSEVPPHSVMLPDSTVVLRRSWPEVYWTVIAEDAGVQAAVDNKMLAAVAESNMRSVSRNVRFSPHESVSLAGRPALSMTAEVRVGGQPLSYDYRLMAHNGFAYQLITWSSRQDREQMHREADRLAAAFELIDPNRVSAGGGGEQLVDRLMIPDAGFSADLSGAAWTTWTERATDFPEASAGALLTWNGGLGVVALPMGGIEATDREVSEVLLATFALSPHSPEVTAVKETRIDRVAGLQFDATRQTDVGGIRYRCYVLRTEQWAYLMACWATADQPDLLEKIDATARRARIDPAARSVPLPAQGENHANLYNMIGLSAYAANDLERALSGFKKACDTDPGIEDYANNAIGVLGELGRDKEAIAFAERHLVLQPAHHEVRANLAFRLALVGQTDAALREFRRAFDGGLDNEPYLAEYVRTIRGTGNEAGALRVLDRYAPAEGAGVDLTLERCLVWAALGRHDEAIALLAERCAGPLPDPLLLSQWVMAHIDAGRANAAAELAAQLTQENGHYAGLWFARGLAEMDLEWYPKARESFQRAFDISGDPTYREFLDHVAGLMGRGDNTLARMPIDPVALPPSIEKLLTERGAAHPEVDDHPARITHDVRAFHFEPGQPLRTTYWLRAEVTGNDALEALSTITESFDSQYERVYVNDVTVRDAAGAVVGRGDLDTYFVIDGQQEGIHSNDKTLKIPVPGLAVGHSVEYTISLQTLAPVEAFPLRRRWFLSDFPCDRRVVYVSGATDRVGFEAGDGISRLPTDAGRAWEVQPVNMLYLEPMLPDLETLGPVLHLGPQGQTWAQVARDYMNDLRPFMAPPAGFSAQARTALGDAESPRAVVARATRHVQDLLTYEAIAFGVRGTIPHTLDQIATQRFGDCKDHSLLLYHLLRAGNVEAHLALVSVGEPLAESLPTLSQFDHMVVYVPQIGGGLVLDATDKSHPALNGTPIGLNKRTLMVLDPDDPRLVDDIATTVPNAYESRRHVTVNDEGDAVVEEVMTARGPWAEALVEFFRGLTPDQQLMNLQSSLAVEDGLRLAAVSTSDLNDPDRPLEVTLRYTVTGAFEREADAWFGRLPAPWEVYYLTPAFLPQRRNDFAQAVGFTFRSAVDFNLPAGTRLASAPRERKYRHAAVNARVSTQTTPTGLKLDAEIALPAGHYPAEEYAAYQDKVDRALRALRPQLRLESR
ncbi:MAG: DUF3857 domain-containing protein [Planctomycetota bacterium]